MQNYKIIYIRNETLPNEYRTPLSPSDVSILSKIGYTIYLQSSKQRIFSDESYKDSGAIITEIPWFSTYFDNIKSKMIIIGLKELSFLDKLNGHTHLYFSHSFKGQRNSSLILESFRNTNSNLYDLEYITQDNKRLISFSYFAGVSGCLLGLLHYYNKLVYPLKPILNIFKYISEKNTISYENVPKIKIIGNGNCSKGVVFILNHLKIPYETLSRKDTKTRISLDSDIIFNCIKLDDNNTSVFFDDQSIIESMLKKDKTIIVDISCDIGKPNNPIPICLNETTWETPILKQGNIDIIAISNLPSLLPRESSEHFSENLLNLLLEPTHIGWKNCLDTYKAYICQ